MKSLHELKNYRSSLSNLSDENSSIHSVKRTPLTNEKTFNPNNTSVFFSFPIKRAMSNLSGMKRLQNLFIDNDSILNTIIFLLILMNTLILCLDHHGISEKNWQILLFMDYAFTFLFLLEIILKIIIMRPRKYFSENFERLDCFIILLNFSQTIYELTQSKVYLSDRGRFEGIKALKILRVFKFVVQRNFWPSASTLFVEMMIAIYNVRHFIAILSIFLIVTSVMARELMAYKIRITAEGVMEPYLKKKFYLYIKKK